jgi:hypothetical protein
MSANKPETVDKWEGSARWICAVSSLMLAANILATILLADLARSAVVTSGVVAVLYLVCGVGYLAGKRWVLTFTLVLVLLTYAGAGLQWLQTRQWIGLLPSLLLAALLWGRHKIRPL